MLIDTYRVKRIIMLIEFSRKRDTLKPGVVKTENGTSIYHRLKAGETDFQTEHVTVGFILNRSPEHEASFGNGQFVRTPMSPGEGWVLPAGVEGKARWRQNLDLLNVHFSASALARVNNGITPDFKILTQVNDPAFVQLALNLHETAEQTETIMRMYRDTMMFALVAHVNRSYGGTVMESLAPKMDPRLQRAVTLAEEKLNTDLSLADLAKEAGMSPFHFTRSFKRATGLPPHQFLATRRVERAKILLKSTQLPIVEIAYRVGYENVSHFSHLFKRVTGGTPSEFRGV
jgi:AraC family transcriptional regulator